MEIQVTEDRAGEVLVLSPEGRLDSANATAFEAVVMNHVRAGERHLVIDFSKLDFISSSGMRVLLIAAKSLRTNKGTLVLCSMKDHIAEVFQISGFSQIIPIKDSRAEALAASA